MTRKPGIFLDGEHEARFELGSGGTELRGIFWSPLRKVVMLLDAEGGDVVFWMNLSSNVLYCFCVCPFFEADIDNDTPAYCYDNDHSDVMLLVFA